MNNLVTTRKISLKDHIEVIFEKDKNLHILFWTLLFMFLIIIDRSESPLLIRSIKSLISVSFFSIIVYINWEILIPKFLRKRNWILYIVSLLLLALIITPPKSLSFYLLYSDFPNIQQYFLDNQNILLFESIFVGAASSAFKITQDWLSHDRDRKELQSQKLESELNFLKSQINPHFLFNTLNNLYALSLKKSNDAPKTVLMLSEMMRYMLYECNDENVPLEKEINYIKNYLELEKIRLGKQSTLEFTVEGDPGNLKIAPLMFIPFIENSFKHGMNHQLDEGFVKIKMLIDKETIEMNLSNNKSSSLPDQIKTKKSGGIGLINIQRRLNLIYPDKHELKIQEENNRYLVDLKIKLT